MWSRCPKCPVASAIRPLSKPFKATPQALRQALQGQVFVSFVVGEDGVVRDAKIVKGLGGGCDETVLAAVAQLPRFAPGQQAERPVAVSYTVPINLAISGLPTK